MKNMGPAGMVGAGLCTLICCSPFVVLTVYMGIYAFNNPDKETWYGIDAAGEQALYPGPTEGEQAGARELVDMHHRFHVWFLWGFIQLLVPCASICILPIAQAIGLGGIMSFLLGSGASCGAFAWWVAGIVWRFRSDGSYTAGDIPP